VSQLVQLDKLDQLGLDLEPLEFAAQFGAAATPDAGAA
jgi:hypothetical protein